MTLGTNDDAAELFGDLGTVLRVGKGTPGVQGDAILSAVYGSDHGKLVTLLDAVFLGLANQELGGSVVVLGLERVQLFLYGLGQAMLLHELGEVGHVDLEGALAVVSCVGREKVVEIVTHSHLLAGGV